MDESLRNLDRETRNDPIRRIAFYHQLLRKSEISAILDLAIAGEIPAMEFIMDLRNRGSLLPPPFGGNMPGIVIGKLGRPYLGRSRNYPRYPIAFVTIQDLNFYPQLQNFEKLEDENDESADQVNSPTWTPRSPARILPRSHPENLDYLLTIYYKNGKIFESVRSRNSCFNIINIEYAFERIETRLEDTTTNFWLQFNRVWYPITPTTLIGFKRDFVFGPEILDAYGALLRINIGYSGQQRTAMIGVSLRELKEAVKTKFIKKSRSTEKMALEYLQKKGNIIVVD